VSEFCRQEKINPGVFRRWRVALEDSARPAAKRSAPRSTAKPAQPFVDLGPLAGNGSRCEIRLELGGGVILSVVRG
jgi:transposase-like protein